MTTANDDRLEQALRAGIDNPSPQQWTASRSRLTERAAGDGLLDVAYAPVGSPLGRLLVAATPAGVVRLAFDTEPDDTVLSELAARLSPRVLEAPSRLDAVRRQLEEYFDGTRTSFDVAVDWALSAGFRRRVLAAAAAIPYGRTGTYRSVATRAGSPQAVRAAGTALATNPVPIIVPCHRVLRSDGALGGYRGGTARKQLLLQTESAAA